MLQVDSHFKVTDGRRGIDGDGDIGRGNRSAAVEIVLLE